MEALAKAMIADQHNDHVFLMSLAERMEQLEKKSEGNRTTVAAAWYADLTTDEVVQRFTAYDIDEGGGVIGPRFYTIYKCKQCGKHYRQDYYHYCWMEPQKISGARVYKRHK